MRMRRLPASVSTAHGSTRYRGTLGAPIGKRSGAKRDETRCSGRPVETVVDRGGLPDNVSAHLRSGCQRLTAEPLVVDLFAGMGGLSLGFREAGFSVRGYDADRHAVASYAANVGPADLMDLGTELPDEDPAVLVGGPPCRPWSPINLHRRRTSHADYGLVDRFRLAVEVMRPCAFVLENVPFLRNDAQYQILLEALT